MSSSQVFIQIMVTMQQCVKLVETKQSGNVESVESVERQCAQERRTWNGGTCIFMYHSHEFFGLSQSVKEEVEGKSIWTWTPPSSYVVSMNGKKINRWKTELEDNK